jgi:hypothetical protein
MADVRVVQTTTMANPQVMDQINQMPAASRTLLMRQAMTAIRTTISIKGNKMRKDTPGGSATIVDSATHTITTINTATRGYTVRPYQDPAPTPNALPVGVQTTGQTAPVAGHQCSRYVLTGNSAMGQIRVDEWIAADLPQPPIELSGHMPPDLAVAQGKIPGMPLMVTMTIGRVAYRTTTQSVSTLPLPASLFAVPAAHKPGPGKSGPRKAR